MTDLMLEVGDIERFDGDLPFVRRSLLAHLEFPKKLGILLDILMGRCAAQ